MQLKHLAFLAAVSGAAVAQRPTDQSICDYYTTALLKENTAKNQATLLTLVVNTAVIGNYTQPNVGVHVAGILAPGMYQGTPVNLLPYFNGGLASSNRGGSSGVAVNFLDDGGAAPLMKNMPANGTSSNQYMLLTHLYSYFGALLGCSMTGTADFPAYPGQSSQYQVHKFMALNSSEIGYFITQVGMSAASFGVAQSDVTLVGNSLNKVFGYRCSAPAVVVPTQPAELQSICIAEDCPQAPENATCASYQAVVKPSVANATLAMGLGNSTMHGNSSNASGSMTMTGTGAHSSATGTATGAGGSRSGTGSAGSAGATSSTMASNGGAAGQSGLVNVAGMALLGGVVAFAL